MKPGHNTRLAEERSGHLLGDARLAGLPAEPAERHRPRGDVPDTVGPPADAITIGIIGEYVARSYKEAKRRPIYVVEEVKQSPPWQPP